MNILCTSNVAKNDVFILETLYVHTCVKKGHRYNTLTTKGETACAQVEISECP